MKNHSSPVVLYDGDCGLCDWSVRFILKHERDDKLKFAALNSAYASSRLSDIVSDSIIIIHPEYGIREKSSALLLIAAHLKAPWRWLRTLRIFPAFLLDICYDLIAVNRYKFNRRIFDCRLQDSEKFKSRQMSI